jgi:hypothetical protein
VSDKNKDAQMEVGDLFVTESSLTLKLLPSRKSGSMAIRWFAGGKVVNVKGAAKDIQVLVGKLTCKSRAVRALTVMTDQGRDTDLVKTRLTEAVSKAGFEVIA